MAARLEKQDWLTDPATRKVLSALGETPDQVRFVGGCVRNALLGEAVEDIDLATVHEPEAVMERLKAAGLGAVPTGIAHGTVTAIVEGRPFEVTTLRADVETDGRHAKVAFTTDWEADARRRDFTMNAIYAAGDGALFDPVGGVADALARRVRFIGDADERIREDYLRILRFFRFHARYGAGAVDETGLAACMRQKEGLARLSGERIQAELLKLLAARGAAVMVSLMQDSEILPLLLPGACRVARLKRLTEIDAECFFTPDPVLRLAALLEDEAAARGAAQRLRVSNKVRDRLLTALRPVPDPGPALVCQMSMRDVRRLLYWIGRQAFTDHLRLAWAEDETAANAVHWRALLAIAEAWERPDFPLTGADARAAGVPDGPLMGQVLRQVETWWVENDFPQDRLALAARLKAAAQSVRGEA